MSPNKRIKRDIIKQYFFEEVPSTIVGPQLTAWQTAPWWPKKCALQYVLDGDQETEGSRWQLKFALALIKPWRGETKRFVSSKEIARIYSGKMFDAYEHILAEERLNGTRVDYRIEIVAKNLLAGILWSLIIKNMINSCIKKILTALRQYVKTQAKEQA